MEKINVLAFIAINQYAGKSVVVDAILIGTAEGTATVNDAVVQRQCMFLSG